jgi:two-component sensor histidine kinase
MQPIVNERPEFPIYLPTPPVRDEVQYRFRQQALLGELARAALQMRDLGKILQRAAELAAQALEVRFAVVSEFVAAEGRLAVRAGVGWVTEAVTEIWFAADRGSPAGYALLSGRPVLCNQLPSEARFQMPHLLSDHGVKRAISAPIDIGERGKALFGVIEVFSADPGRFDQADADFLAAFARLLGSAIQRQQADAKVQEALDYQALLTREMSHRVKNSLASVVGLLRVQSRNTHSDDAKAALEEAGARVTTIAQVHDHLWRSSRIGFIDLADFMKEICQRLQGAAGANVLNCRAEPMLLAADHAIPLGLLVNELIANAVKHGHPSSPGVIDISTGSVDGRLRVEIADNGVGLPEGFDINQPRTSLGFKVINGMVRQLHGTLTITSSKQSGARFLVELPILAGEGPGPPPASSSAERACQTASSPTA